MKEVARKEVSAVCEEYKEILGVEKHHSHKIIEVNGVLRWEPNPSVKLLLEYVNLNDVVAMLHSKDISKNSEEYRRLYRDMGYSLSGYWEVFYWDLNHEDCADYNPKVAT